MANNCLVTKLKGTINNDNLPKLGYLKIYVGSSGTIHAIQTNTTVRPTVGKNVYVTIIDDHITITGAENGATMIDSKHGIFTNAYNSRLLINGAEYSEWINIEVKMKYDFNTIRGAGIYDLSEFKHCSSLRFLIFNPGYGREQGVPNDISGNIEDLAHITTLETYTVEYMPHIYGSINKLGPLVNLTTFNFAMSELKPNNVTGSFDGFVAAQKENGRTTCTGINITHAANFKLPMGNVKTFWDDPTGTLTAILKWDGDKIDMFMDEKKRAFVMGYTQSEIDAMTAIGGVYEGYIVTKCD